MTKTAWEIQRKAGSLSPLSITFASLNSLKRIQVISSKTNSAVLYTG